MLTNISEERGILEMLQIDCHIPLSSYPEGYKILPIQYFLVVEEMTVLYIGR